MRMKEENEKAGLKLNIQEMKIMASGPITSRQMDGKKKWKQWQILFSWAPISLQMVTVAMKLFRRCLLLRRKAMTKLDSILKSRDITLLTKACIVKAMIFPVVMYGCEIWLWRRLSAEELMLLNCGVGEDSWESIGLQGDPTCPFWRRSTLGFLWKEWC